MAVGSPVAASFMFVVESTIWCKNHGAKVFKCDSTLTQLFVTLEGFKSELERCFYGYNVVNHYVKIWRVRRGGGVGCK